MLFDARRKLRAALVTNGYLDTENEGPTRAIGAVDRFLRTDPRDVGCERAMELLHVYVDLVAADRCGRTPRQVAVHLAACGPCSKPFAGLLAAAVGSAV
jgi:hypothetical protein